MDQESKLSSASDSSKGGVNSNDDPESIASEQSELDDSNDSAFAKTPVRPDSDGEEDDDEDTSSGSSSGASAHINDYGDKTYFHVWSDMLTCNEMAALDVKATNEVPNYCADDPKAAEGTFKPLSIDTSLPCPLIQFGPLPKRRPPGAAAVTAATGAAAEVAASATAGDEASGGHNSCQEKDLNDKKVTKSAKNEKADGKECEDSERQHIHDERCCDFSVVAAKNRARLRLEAKLRRREQKRLVRY